MNAEVNLSWLLSVRSPGSGLPTAFSHVTPCGQFFDRKTLQANLRGGHEAALNVYVMEICLVALVALLLLGSIGAFFLYVPFLSIALVISILMGMTLAFLLGVWAGGTRRRISRVL